MILVNAHILKLDLEHGRTDQAIKFASNQEQLTYLINILDSIVPEFLEPIIEQIAEYKSVEHSLEFIPSFGLTHQDYDQFSVVPPHLDLVIHNYICDMPTNKSSEEAYSELSKIEITSNLKYGNYLQLNVKLSEGNKIIENDLAETHNSLFHLSNIKNMKQFYKKKISYKTYQMPTTQWNAYEFILIAQTKGNIYMEQFLKETSQYLKATNLGKTNLQELRKKSTGIQVMMHTIKSFETPIGTNIEISDSQLTNLVPVSRYGKLSSLSNTYISPFATPKDYNPKTKQQNLICTPINVTPSSLVVTTIIGNTIQNGTLAAYSSILPDPLSQSAVFNDAIGASYTR